MRLRAALAVSMAIAFAGLSGCSKSASSESPAVVSGRKAYMANCALCHNTNPNLPGSLGPPIAGAPRQLVEARVLHRSYPPGYKPQRGTHLMRPLPWLAPKIDDLTAFLAYAKNQPK